MDNKSFLSEYQKLNLEQKITFNTIKGQIIIIASIGTDKTTVENILVKILKRIKNNYSKIFSYQGIDTVFTDKETKKISKNTLTIGIYSDYKEKTFIKNLKQEENKFHINEAISNCDVVIEKNESLPNVVKVAIFKGLVDKGFIDAKLFDPYIHLPKRGKTGSTKEPVLFKKEIPLLLDIFIHKNKNKNIFVIQGGNRYIYTLLSQQRKKGIYSIKLLDIGKVNLNVLLNTLLTLKERISLINPKIQKIISLDFFNLSKDKQNLINNIIANNGFNSINEYLKYAPVGEIINLFCSFSIPSPFSYPADDRKIKKEFEKIIPFSINIVNSISERKIIESLISNTLFYKKLNTQTNKSVFIDDVFYRGRTYFTLNVLSLLFNIDLNKWKLFTLCSDRVSKNIFDTKIEVLKRGVLYPFENSIQTERGYWEECRNFFVFRDMCLYTVFLEKMINPKKIKKINKDWDVLINRISKKIKYKKLPKPFIKILLEMFIYFCAFDQSVCVDTILDQRAKNIGYCTPFVKLISIWINQEEPRWKRQEFKDKVSNCFTIIDSLFKDKTNKLINEAIDIYKKNNKEIDYYYLQSFYKI